MRGILAGLWSRASGSAHASAPVETPALLGGPEQASAEPAFRFDDERIPAISRERVADLLALVQQVEAQAENLPQSGDMRDEARRIRHHYLPELLNSYFALPPEHRAAMFRRTGRSASIQLNARIDILIDQLKAISAALADGYLDQFTRQLTFIDQRFDPGELWR